MPGVSAANRSPMQQVTHREVREMLSSGAQIAETLPKHEYETTHIAGAIHLPLHRVFKQARELLAIDQPVIVYCRDAL